MIIHEVGGCTIIQGENIEAMREFPANSVPVCVTDPPYGIGFMGKKWDTFDSGAADKRAVPSQVQESDNPNLKGRARSPAASPSAVEYDRTLQGQRGFQSWTEAWAREVFRVLRPGGHMLVCGAPRSYHRMASGVEDAGFEIRDCIMWVFGQGFPKSHNLHDDWEGWGTAFKPAWEPILVARKPLEGTVAQNVARYGTGALNIDASRIETDPSVDDPRLGGKGDWSTDKMAKNVYEGGYEGERVGSSTLGRWPANLIHDGSDEVLECFPDAKGQLAPTRNDNKSQGNAVYGSLNHITTNPEPRGDTGSAARFFYCAKTSRKDRDEGCETLPLLVADTAHKRPRSELDDPRRAGVTPRTNGHPTVKPTALMRYLVKLVTPPGGVVLDPFFGSGSTGKACLLEGFNCIGIEREADYVAIAKARCEYALDPTRAQIDTTQLKAA